MNWINKLRDIFDRNLAPARDMTNREIDEISERFRARPGPPRPYVIFNSNVLFEGEPVEYGILMAKILGDDNIPDHMNIHKAQVVDGRIGFIKISSPNEAHVGQPIELILRLNGDDYYLRDGRTYVEGHTVSEITLSFVGSRTPNPEPNPDPDPIPVDDNFLKVMMKSVCLIGSVLFSMGEGSTNDTLNRARDYEKYFKE